MQIDNPDSKKVAEVASAAGEKWRSLSEEEKKGYEEASHKAKVVVCQPHVLQGRCNFTSDCHYCQQPSDVKHSMTITANT